MITDKLLKGIQSKDWQLIIEVYETLSGQRYEEQIDVIEKTIPQKKKAAKKKPKQVQVQDSPEEESDEVSATLIESEYVTTKRQPKKATKKRKNLFESMNITIEKEPGYDKINDKVKRTPRNRPAFKPVQVKCTRCGKEESVAPIFARDGYKCNKCAGRS